MHALDELNDKILAEIPEILKNDLISFARIYTSKRNYCEIILTDKLILYEIRNKHILSSFDLTGTILRKGR